MRRDHVGDDLLGGDVGKRPFQAVADLDVQFMFRHEDEEDRPVVLPLLADVPALGDPDGVILDRRIGLHRRVDRHHDLVGSRLFELLQLGIEPRRRPGGEDMGVVVAIGRRRGRHHLDGAGGSRPGDEEADQGEDRKAERGRRHDVGRIGTITGTCY